MTQEAYGTFLAAGMMAVVAALLAWQRLDRQRRGGDLSADDRVHFRNQEVRRGVVSVVMALLAVGVYFGSRMPHRQGGRPNTLFIETWIGIFALVFVLLGLALTDWLATRRYARRHRTAIIHEGMELLREEMRLRSGSPSDRGPAQGKNGPPH